MSPVKYSQCKVQSSLMVLFDLYFLCSALRSFVAHSRLTGFVRIVFDILIDATY